MSDEATEPTDLEIAQGILKGAEKFIRDAKKQMADIKRAQKALSEAPEIVGPFTWHPCARTLGSMQKYVEKNIAGRYVLPILDYARPGSLRDVRVSYDTAAGTFTVTALQQITLAGFLVVE